MSDTPWREGVADSDSVLEVPALVPEDMRQRLLRGRRVMTTFASRRMIWYEWQPEDGRLADEVPVVLFHGGSGSWTHWLRNIVPLLDADRRVLAADLPGFGQSDLPPTGSDADAMVASLAAGLDELVGDQAIDLVGFSFGGLSAGLMLAEHPNRARCLVLVGAPAMGVIPRRQFELRAWRHLKTEAEQMDAHRHNLAALMLRDAGLIDGRVLGLHVGNVMRDRTFRRRLAHTDILAQRLAKVGCPVHAIYGASDAIYGPYIGGLGAAFAAAAPDFRGIELIDGAGHWVQFEAPTAFDAALQRALG